MREHHSTATPSEVDEKIRGAQPLLAAHLGKIGNAAAAFVV